MAVPAFAFGAVVRRSRRRLPLLGASALIGTLSLLAMPITLANAIDSAVSGDGAGTWTWIAAMLILLGVACDLVDAFAETTCTADAAAWLRHGLVERMLGIPHRIREFDTGDLVARTSAGAADAAQAGPGVIGALTAILPPVGGLAMLLWLDWRLAAAFAAGLALVAVVLRLFAKETAAAAVAYQRVQGTMAARLTEAIGGRRTIAAAGTVDAETERVLQELPELAEHGRASWRALSSAGARAAFAGPLATVGVLVVAGFLVAQGTLSAGEVLAAGQYAMLGAGLGSLTGVLGVLARAKAAVARLGEVHAVPMLEYGDSELPGAVAGTNGSTSAIEVAAGSDAAREVHGRASEASDESARTQDRVLNGNDSELATAQDQPLNSSHGELGETQHHSLNGGGVGGRFGKTQDRGVESDADKSAEDRALNGGDDARTRDRGNDDDLAGPQDPGDRRDEIARTRDRENGANGLGGPRDRVRNGNGDNRSTGGVLPLMPTPIPAARRSDAATSSIADAPQRRNCNRPEPSSASPIATHPERGRLELRGVTVEGPAGPLLDDVSFTVPGGAVAAVVGASGSGKSVLAAVAARLRDPDRGEVLLDGVPLPRLSPKALRDAVGIASERPALAGATLADAMGPGRPREAVLASAAAVGADGFAERLPDGYDTPLDQVPMSGGEAQRIGLARAWRAERLLVLDDATAALDAVSELRIAEALAASGRTRLVVTHKAQVAAQADIVVWLHGGTVRAAGPHQTLWTDPDYREVFHQ